MKEILLRAFSFCLFFIDLAKESKWGFWIGLFDSNSSFNNWDWSDGTSFTYSNWEKGEPNDKDQHCAGVSKKPIDLLFTFTICCV